VVLDGLGEFGLENRRTGNRSVSSNLTHAAVTSSSPAACRTSPDRISSYGNTGPNGAYCIAQSRTPTNLSLEYQTAGSICGPIRSNIRRA
jgi:hypothetical protein